MKYDESIENEGCGDKLQNEKDFCISMNESGVCWGKPSLSMNNLQLSNLAGRPGSLKEPTVA
jgi:hypothetical protein